MKNLKNYQMRFTINKVILFLFCLSTQGLMGQGQLKDSTKPFEYAFILDFNDSQFMIFYSDSLEIIQSEEKISYDERRRRISVSFVDINGNDKGGGIDTVVIMVGGETLVGDKDSNNQFIFYLPSSYFVDLWANYGDLQDTITFNTLFSRGENSKYGKYPEKIEVLINRNYHYKWNRYREIKVFCDKPLTRYDIGMIKYQFTFQESIDDKYKKEYGCHCEWSN